jgi:hypothetical protein
MRQGKRSHEAGLAVLPRHRQQRCPHKPASIWPDRVVDLADDRLLPTAKPEALAGIGAGRIGRQIILVARFRSGRPQSRACQF